MSLELQIILQTLGEFWLVLSALVIIGTTAQSIKDFKDNR